VAGTDFVHGLRRRAGRPQLKRDPLGDPPPLEPEPNMSASSKAILSLCALGLAVCSSWSWSLTSSPPGRVRLWITSVWIPPLFFSC